MPLLFITIACGAVSGFHSLVASGTTARQIRRESDARVIGYGGMLTEGLLAVFVIVACVAGFTRAEFDATYATYTGGGLSAFLIGGSRVMAAPFQRILPASVSPDATVAFFKNLVSVMVVSFAMTTLDSGTRLLRYNIEELGKSLRLKPIQGRYVASVIAVAAIGYFALMKINGEPAGLTLWQLFGTSNQMLATLGLLVASVYLYQLRKPVIYTLVPMFCMLAIVVWAIAIKLSDFYHGWQESGDTGNLSLLIIGSILAVMAAWTMLEAVSAFLRTRRRIAQGTPTH
jgi:carbon starvation protein